jgi:hypothetical protein
MAAEQAEAAHNMHRLLQSVALLTTKIGQNFLATLDRLQIRRDAD